MAATTIGAYAITGQRGLWTVDGGEGHRYQVRKLEEAGWTCTCPAWVNRDGPCKHIVMVHYSLAPDAQESGAGGSNPSQGFVRGGVDFTFREATAMSGNGSAFQITSGGGNLPSKGIFYGVPGIGKTSIASQAPRPVFIMTRGENGLLTLIDNGIIGPTDHFPEVDSWPSLLKCLDILLLENTGHKTLVLDTLNGAERLCFEHVAATKYDGNWEGFTSFGRGPEVALAEWLRFVHLLHKLNAQKKVGILLLAHCRIKTFKNPEGDDYDRYSAEMNEKTWGQVEKWADLVLFGNYETFAKKKSGELKAKAAGGVTRMFFTQRTAAYDAKNRLNLPPTILMGRSPQEAWSNLAREIKAARQKLAPAQEPAKPAPTEEPVVAQA